MFRRGDPCDNHDLIRVAAHKATSIVVMMNVPDLEAEAKGDGQVTNLDLKHGKGVFSGGPKMRPKMAKTNMAFSIVDFRCVSCSALVSGIRSTTAPPCGASWPSGTCSTRTGT